MRRDQMRKCERLASQHDRGSTQELIELARPHLLHWFIQHTDYYQTRTNVITTICPICLWLGNDTHNVEWHQKWFLTWILGATNASQSTREGLIANQPELEIYILVVEIYFVIRGNTFSWNATYLPFKLFWLVQPMHLNRAVEVSSQPKIAPALQNFLLGRGFFSVFAFPGLCPETITPTIWSCCKGCISMGSPPRPQIWDHTPRFFQSPKASIDHRAFLADAMDATWQSVQFSDVVGRQDPRLRLVRFQGRAPGWNF